MKTFEEKYEEAFQWYQTKVEDIIAEEIMRLSTSGVLDKNDLQLAIKAKLDNIHKKMGISH